MRWTTIGAVAVLASAACSEKARTAVRAFCASPVASEVPTSSDARAPVGQAASIHSPGEVIFLIPLLFLSEHGWRSIARSDDDPSGYEGLIGTNRSQRWLLAEDLVDVDPFDDVAS